MVHLHEVRDTDTHYLIDPITMAITNANEAKNKLMLGDHNSEIYTFEIPKVVEGHDMSLRDLIEVHFINISQNKMNKSEGIYRITDMTVEGDNIAFSWTVDGSATQYAGSLNYRIKFACVGGDGSYTYRKWTGVYEGISVSDGFDNGENVLAGHSDIISQWEARLNSLESAKRLATILILASEWRTNAEIPCLHFQVVEIAGITEHSKVDLLPSVEQLAIFYDKDVTFLPENDGGTVTLYAIGEKPTLDYTMQVQISEVWYE